MVGARVLVVDDSSFMRKRLKSILEKAGHKVVGTARDGREGFELYESTRPDLVIMDITMQGIDGIEGARLIKREFPSARIVFMSLVEDEGIRKQAKELDALGFLGKKEHERLLDIIAAINSKEEG